MFKAFFLYDFPDTICYNTVRCLNIKQLVSSLRLNKFLVNYEYITSFLFCQ
nr:MAG TPA: hypothetical protein [Caudoviricetes sp.]